MRAQRLIPHFAMSVLLVLFWLIPSRSVYAADICTAENPCEQGQAYQAAMNRAKEAAAEYTALYPDFPRYPKVSLSDSKIYYRAYIANGSNTITSGCIVSASSNQRSCDYEFRQTCSSRGSKITKFYPPSGSVACDLGCEVKYRQNGDDETTTYSPTGNVCYKAPDCAAQGVNMVWNSYLGVCQPVAPECEAGFKLVGNSCVEEKPCPDGMALQNGVCKVVGEECPAGSTKLPDGTCHKKECPEGSVRGDDGTCKPPPKENCEAGDTECEKKNEQFSGGDGCDVPPICSGSPILCGQARIQWRIDCNTRRNTNISGGPCSHSGTPTCTGEKCDAIEYAQLVMQWRAACAVEKMAENSSNSGSGGDNTGTTPTPDTSGVSDGELSGQAPNDGDATGAFSDGSNAGNGSGSGNGSGNGNGLNSSGYGWSRSCPTPPTVNLMGQAITFNVGPFCNWMVLGGWLVLLFSALLSLRILSSSSNS